MPGIGMTESEIAELETAGDVEMERRRDRELVEIADNFCEACDRLNEAIINLNFIRGCK